MSLNKREFSHRLVYIFEFRTIIELKAMDLKFFSIPQV
jgi:hypothetical protein